ncbi:MAG: sialate O-acetylesterase [Phycisphaerae bacterium]|nr:sialate O-acetylesterase [Phycisphaerae bacterium]
MRSRFFFTLLLLGVLAGATWAQENPLPGVQKDAFHLYLLAGQSNMAGRGVLTEQDKTAHPRVFALNRENRWVPAVEPLHFDKPAIVGVGPGLAFGKAMAEADPNVIVGLVPCAVGGSPISVWRPQAHYPATGVHPYDDAIARCRIAGQRGVFKGVLWHQGESDSNAEDGPLYAQRLTELIRRLRQDLSAPDLLFVAGTPADAFIARTPDSRFVIEAIRAAAKVDERVFWVSAAGLACKDDQVHFNTEAARTLGLRYAQAMLRRQNLTLDDPRP